MLSDLGYEQNAIVDAFLLCGHPLTQFQLGFKWEPNVVLEQIKVMEELVPCAICRQLVNEGWVEHAIVNHCDGRQIRSDQLKFFRLSKGTECLICNLVYRCEEEKEEHINLHLRDRLTLSKQIPLQRKPEIERLSSNEKAMKLKTYLHFNFYKHRNIYLYMFIPSWLRGETVKEKLRNLEKPTYIPIAMSSKSAQLCKAGMKSEYYDIYKIMLYTPAMDAKFNGVREYRRMYGKLLIRLVASLQQQPDSMKMIKVILCKNERGSSYLFDKYINHVTDADINEVLQDVLVNRQTVLCVKDLFEEHGCVDSRCACFIHFRINFSLERGATEPREDYVFSKRHYSLNFELGMFEFELNPDPNRWMEFAAELICRRRYHILNPTATFVYIVLCARVVDTMDLPSLANRERFTGNRRNQYNVYVGLSRLNGIPPHHFTELDKENDEDDEDDDSQYEVNEDGERVFTGSTELTKAMKRGLRALYMLRLSRMANLQQAEMLEASVQLFGWLANEFWDDENPVRIINKRIEFFSLSFLSLTELQGIIELIQENVHLFYESPDAIPDAQANRNWGILGSPLFLNNMIQLPL